MVVGGGQAGLAIGYLLSGQDCDFTILETAANPAAAWRERWPSSLLGWVKDAEHPASQISAVRVSPSDHRRAA